ncbi:OmpA family protein [Massilia yuzhufengensis]|uniref:Outer membrane protein OmpA n=1 Tax=Massilia yuzhufengensis TaxID=1164594 RepID=A0A1I1VLT8_9BURK|nr:OmpA family protein [Massilia yuzhufengensis]SFD82013.1 Outer membrane protein OmpA [Massilia yuzhufengensis]
MFEELSTTLGQKFGLGMNARPFLQMLLARISDPRHGGFAGFVQRLRDGGVAVDTWAATPGAEAALSPSDIERAVGDHELVPDMASRFGIERSKVIGALGFAIPAIVARLARGGVAPATLPPEAESFIGNRGAWAAAPTMASQAGAVQAPARNWLPWIAAAVVLLLLLGYCSTQRRSEPVPAAPAPVITESVPAPGAPAAPVPDLVVTEPEGAAIVAGMADGIPVLKVYFDVGKTLVSSEFKEKSADLVAYLNTNPNAKAIISGFNDPTGDAAANAKLAKGRAEAVQEQLVAAGIAKDRTLLEKPADTTGTAPTNAASRRVDVMLR